MSVLAGDVIVGINDVKVTKASDLARALDDLKVGDKVSLTAQRGAENSQVGFLCMHKREYTYWLLMTWHVCCTSLISDSPSF